MTLSSQERTAIMNIVAQTIQALPKQPTLQDDVLVDTGGASKILHIPASTLVKWRSTGEANIPFIRINRQIKYRTTDLLAYIESHTHNKVEAL